ncbi:TPA: hypothetical protein ACOD42_005636 [Klebsiella pneumoniae]
MRDLILQLSKSSIYSTKPCIDIKDEGYPHLGLWYLFDINDEFTLIEVTTTILELSSFFQRNEGGVVVPL